MSATANKTVPKKGKIGRVVASLWDFAHGLDSAGFDYTLDRIGCLEREVAQLREDLRNATAADH